MKLSKYMILAVAPLLMASCLDTEPEGNVISADQKSEVVKENPARLEASVTAIPTNFSAYGAVFGSSSNQHNDIGYPTIMLVLDSRGIDMVSANDGYNWYRNSLTYDDIDYTSSEDRLIWNTLYTQIYSANSLLAISDKESTDASTQGYMAQAYAIRAFDYLQLVQMYQKTYAQVDPATALGVPLVTDANMETASTEGCPRATVAATYEQIISDISTAITLLEKSGYSRPDKRYVDLQTAHAIRARAYLVMQNYTAALEDANWVITNGSAKPTSIAEASKPAFKDLSETNWIWGIKISENDRVVTTGICNFPSHMGTFNYGYASAVGMWRKVSKKLFAQINATDARKGWFLDENAQSANLNAEQAAYIADNSVPAYVQVKFAPYKDVIGTSTNASDIPLIRAEEMYLIKAECEAHTNPAQGAATLQDFVRTYRDPLYTFTASSTESVVEAILTQRRIEFWGEGITWFDMIRLNKDFDRRGAGFAAAQVFNIPAGDDCLIWRIPYNEIQYNNQISEEQNNPVGVMPTAVVDN